WLPSGNSNDDILNACAGNYTLTATDSIGCISQLQAIVNEPDSVEINFETTNETCFGNDGTVTAHVTGGVGDFLFEWSNLQTGVNDSIATLLSSGFVVVTVTHSTICQTIDSVFVNADAPLLASIKSFSNTTCFNDTNGN